MSPTEQTPPAGEQILVIRFSSLGDVLLAAPALRGLRARFPDAHIDFLTAAEYADAASLIPGTDRILRFDRSRGFPELRRMRRQLARCYDVVVDLQNSFRSAYLRSLLFPTFWAKASRYRLRRWLLIRFKWDLYGDIIPVPVRYFNAVEMLGAKPDERGLELIVPNEAVEWATHFLAEAGGEGKQLIVLCPGAKHFTKRWPEERWVELAKRFPNSDQLIVFIGDGSEAELITSLKKSVANSIVVIGESIPRVAAALKQARMVVANDSGIMHLAAGVGAPVVAIFGPTVRQFGFAPFSSKARIVEQNLSCRPCSAFGGEQCPQKHFRCMLDATADDVCRQIQDLTAKF